MISFPEQASPVTEIRVHGVGGTSPMAMLGRSDLVQVSGDDISGFYRSASGDSGRTIEAYSWGGLTASSASRALWVLLLPFSLVNIAGWMIEPSRERHPPPEGAGGFAALDRFVCRLGSRLPARTSERLQRLQLWWVHILALAFSATYVQLAAYLAVDLFAYQCGGDPACRARFPLRDLLGTEAQVGRRLVMGVAVPVLLLIVFLYLARRSRLTYESYRPMDGTEATTDLPSLSLEDPLIWDRVRYQTVMARLHASTCVGILLVTLAGTLRQLIEPGPGARGTIQVVATVVGVALAVASLSMVMLIAARAGVDDRSQTEVIERLDRFTQVGFWLGWATLALAAAGAWNLQPARALPAVNWFALAPLVLLTVAIAVGALLALCQALRWLAECHLQTDQFVVVVVAVAVALAPRPAVLAGGAALLLLLNVAAPPVEGRQTALLDLGVLGALALAGWVLSQVLGEPAFLWAGVALSAVTAAFLWLARRPEDGFRWAGTGAVGAFAALILLGVFSGGIVRTARLLSGGDLVVEYPAFYDWAVVAVTLSLGVAVFSLLLYGVRAFVVRFGGWHEEAEARLTRAGYPEPTRDDVSMQSVIFRTVAETARAIDVMITLAATILFATGVAGAWKMATGGRDFAQWFDRDFPLEWTGLLDLAAWLAVGAVVGAYLAVRSGLRNEATRRKIGMVWDVASFFPRSFHPFAPPSYAARAVPEIQARIREKLGNGERVILAGHSQGSVIAAAVMASLPATVTAGTALVTYGSPLGSIYRPFFPLAVSDQLVGRIAAKVGPGAEAGRLLWANFYRRTDPIAGRAFKVGELEDRALRSELTEALVKYGRRPRAGDVELEDPWEEQVVPFRPVPRLRVHSGYESDPAWVETMAVLASVLAPTPSSPDSAGGP
jgi:hypothetical protein